VLEIIGKGDIPAHVIRAQAGFGYQLT